MAMDLQLVTSDVDSFYSYCSERPQGVTTADLKSSNEWRDQTQVLACANELLAQGRLSLTQLGPGQLLYQAIDQQTANKFRNLDREHRMVYQEIEKAGDKGCWSKTLKDVTNLQQHSITKLTKELIRRQLVKEVKSVAQRGRKVFMLWDVEPSKAVSGGTFYQDGEFAASWIESLRQRCQQYLEANQGKIVTLQDLHAHIQEQPGPSTPSQEDVAAIMRTLELDEIVYSVLSANGTLIYTKRNGGFDLFAGRLPSFITRLDQSDAAGCSVPCLLCPLQGECRVGGRIAPEKCGYIATWLRGGWGNASAGGRGAEQGKDVKMNDW